MKNLKTICITLAMSIAACGGEEADVEHLGIPSWEDYKSAAEGHWEGETFYRIEGDLPVTLEQLRTHYDWLVAQEKAERGLGSYWDVAARRHKVTVAVDGSGNDRVWSATDAQNLTYCVSNDFGADKTRVINEMRLATGQWEAHANVDFIYLSQYDGSCTDSNTNVKFVVRPWNQGGACAFFPPSGSSCPGDRNLWINLNDIDTNSGYGNVDTVGVFRHELGHILGLRHEHIRASNPGRCTESAGRAVTDYDNKSVMHYPWCPGGDESVDLALTPRDAHGIALLYPGLRKVAFRTGNGRFFRAVDAGGGNVRADAGHVDVHEVFSVKTLNGGKIGLRTHDGYFWRAHVGGGHGLFADVQHTGSHERFEIVPRSNGKVALQTHYDYYVVAEGNGGGEANANRTRIGGWEQFDLVELNGELISLTAWNGKNLWAVSGGHSTVRADRTHLGFHEKHRLVRIGSNQVAIRTDDGTYLRAESGGGASVRADQWRIDDHEIFTLIENSDGTVSFRTHNGQYLTVEADEILDAHSTSIGAREKFTLTYL